MPASAEPAGVFVIQLASTGFGWQGVTRSAGWPSWHCLSGCCC
jgi:hypothetical protein